MKRAPEVIALSGELKAPTAELTAMKLPGWWHGVEQLLVHRWRKYRVDDRVCERTFANVTGADSVGDVLSATAQVDRWPAHRWLARGRPLRPNRGARP